VTAEKKVDWKAAQTASATVEDLVGGSAVHLVQNMAAAMAVSKGFCLVIEKADSMVGTMVVVKGNTMADRRVVRKAVK
jgi:hypothetical protein